MEETMQHKVLLNSLALGLAVLLATAICVTAQTASGLFLEPLEMRKGPRSPINAGGNETEN
jgi:hypothetical protein